jgi:hypothetical protein
MEEYLPGMNACANSTVRLNANPAARANPSVRELLLQDNANPSSVNSRKISVISLKRQASSLGKKLCMAR